MTVIKGKWKGEEKSLSLTFLETKTVRRPRFRLSQILLLVNITSLDFMSHRFYVHTSARHQ